MVMVVVVVAVVVLLINNPSPRIMSFNFIQVKQLLGYMNYNLRSTARSLHVSYNTIHYI